MINTNNKYKYSIIINAINIFITASNSIHTTYVNKPDPNKEIQIAQDIAVIKGISFRF